jgi:hypothetical protein
MSAAETEKDFCGFTWPNDPRGAPDDHVCLRPAGHAGNHQCICTAIEEEEKRREME